MKSTIQYPEFDAVDIRVGKIIAASAPEWSNKLLQFTVDFGPELGEKTIFSGVKQWYSPDEFEGNLYIFVVNLAERKMGEGVSQGMMLMADGEDKPVPIPVPPLIPAGTILR